MNEGFRRPDPRILEFANISRGAKVQEGLFKVYQKEDAAYLELQPQHLGKPILCPIAVAKGAGMGGMTLNFDEQWVLLFKRAGEKVHLIRRNVHFKARAGTPTARAVDITYTDSVLMSLRIAAINQMNQGLLINLNDIFMTDFAELNLGAFDSSRSVWGKIKVFPRNIELEVQATYSSGRFGGGDSNIDSRGQTVVIHYGLAELPDGGYQPRVADDRVGYFVTAVKDFSSTSKDTAFVRYVNRWRLEPADQIDVKNGKLSVPKRSIKFYIEKTVPHEYRAAVQEGILEWNKAFEKIGFRNAIEVVQQRDDEDFDPEDMNYNTFRWITSDSAFAMGPSRANPLTGEILDADIIFDADLIRFWKQERQIFRQNGIEFESPSSILAMDMGFGLNHQLLNRRSINGDWNESPKRMSESQSLNRLRAIQQGVCQCGSHMKYELGMAALAQIQRELLPQPKEKAPGDKDKPKDKDKEKSDKEKADANKDKILDELIHQAIKAIVMHEVGHTLGLRHNFKGSTMLANDQLHDTKITHEKGLLGSVMDYAPVNLAPKGVKQGDYFTTTLGPYDFWAIEYAYKPLTGGTDGEVTELKKIASRGASEAGLDYGTDEDTFLTSDPLINRWDMGNDVMKFSQDRMLIAQELLKNLANQVVDEGEGYQRTRVAFNLLLNQYGNSSYLIAKYVGGEHAYRDHRGDPKGRDPLVPVNTTKQREALKFLQENIFTDKTFQYPPDLLRKLAVDRWSHWGADTDSTDFSVHNRVLSIQRMAMNQLLSVSALERIQNNSLKSEKDGKPLQISEVFRTITDGVWSDLPKGDKKATASSAIRRNLQREHLKKLSEIVLGEKSGGFGIMFFFSGGGSLPPDAKSLAFAHLKEINKRIEAALKDKPADADETTLAHLEECHDRIAKILNASMQIND
ncbi:zinc-dependent metalloprotease [Telmatocola sphagniphila]|uniref:Zinc-dependent metalloprotease n=1 Tax=Telmatocola sphagniphila TaxID=1123043 RepID=A0A8E6B9K8_9BACT|nr:zinc-dependent metalloprotease [Telmatocola sphagniphila]QVL34407.1 zinc-dependent metalloprotease [Telmatocola sphagniphila]